MRCSLLPVDDPDPEARLATWQPLAERFASHLTHGARNDIPHHFSAAC
jgi:hypothetical protein